MGRPTKYKKEFCLLLIEHMSQGYSLSSFPAVLYEKYDKLKVVPETFSLWRKKHPEWAEAVKVGQAAALRFFERFLRIHITGAVPAALKERQNKKMSSSMVMFALKTRFYREYGDQLKLQGVQGGAPIDVKADKGTDLEGIPTKILEIVKSIKQGNELTEEQKQDIEKRLSSLKLLE